MKPTINNISSELEQKNRPTAKSALAAAVVSAAVLAACGGNGDDDHAVNPDPTPDPTPEVLPPVPPVIVGAMNANGKSIPDILKNFDGRITAVNIAKATTNGITSCAVAPNADGGYTLIINPQDPNAKVEAADSCNLKGTGDKVEQKVTVESFLDTKAPEVQNTVLTLDGGNVDSYKILDIKEKLGNITDKSAFTIDIPKGQPYSSGYTFIYTPAAEGKAATATLTAESYAQSTNLTGNVTDALGNATPFSVNVTRVDNTPPEETDPPPTEPTCPSGTSPVPGHPGLCM
jgi:hypothetical protein